MEDYPSVNIYYYSVLDRYTGNLRYARPRGSGLVLLIEAEEIIGLETFGFCWIEAGS